MGGLERRVREAVGQYHTLNPGDQVVVAVSGRADSVHLLALLYTPREPWGARLRILHIHHGFGRKEADQDTDFVRSLCEGFRVPYHILKIDMCGLAAEKGMSEKEADRFLCYEASEREAADQEDRDRTGLDGGSVDNSVRPMKIAVAHHSGDQVGIIPYNLFWGSGLSGIKGIVYRRGKIIRPLLDADRDCIFKWLANHGLSYMRDFTNNTPHYTQNRIRNQLLPETEQYVNRGAAGGILRLGHLATQADKYLEDQVTAWIKAHMRKGPGAYIPAEALLGEPEVLRSYVVMSFLKELGGASRDLRLAHVSQVMELAGRPAGKQMDLLCGLAVVREHRGIWMGKGDPTVEEGQGDLSIVDMEVFFQKKGMKSPKNMYTKWSDCDKIKGTPVVRTRCPGDHIILVGHNHKALNRSMIDEKIPRQMRDKIPLLADSSYVMWIIGYRMSEYYKIGPDTVRVLQAEADQTRKRKEQVKWEIG